MDLFERPIQKGAGGAAELVKRDSSERVGPRRTRRILGKGMTYRGDPLEDTVCLSEVSGRGVSRWRTRSGRFRSADPAQAELFPEKVALAGRMSE